MVARRARPGQRHAAAGLRGGRSRQPGLPLGPHRRGGRSPGRRGDPADPHARRAAAAVGLGEPEPRQPALPPQRPGVRGVRRGSGPALRHPRGPLHPLERAQPAVVDPAEANCGRKRCSPASADTYRAMVNAGYQAIHSADPAAIVLIGALAPAGGALKSRNANTRPLTFLRALACLDAKLRPVTPGGCRGFQPALADGFAYHPHSTRNPPDQPFATADNADLASLARIEHLLDLMQRWGRIRGSTAPLGIWLDEYGFQTNPPDKLRGVSPGRQDLYLQQAAYLAWRDPRVQLLS